VDLVVLLYDEPGGLGSDTKHWAPIGIVTGWRTEQAAATPVWIPDQGVEPLSEHLKEGRLFDSGSAIEYDIERGTLIESGKADSGAQVIQPPEPTGIGMITLPEDAARLVLETLGIGSIAELAENPEVDWGGLDLAVQYVAARHGFAPPREMQLLCPVHGTPQPCFRAH